MSAPAYQGTAGLPQSVARLLAGKANLSSSLVLEKGKAVMTQVADLVSEILETGQKGIKKEDLATCKEVLRRFHRNLL